MGKVRENKKVDGLQRVVALVLFIAMIMLCVPCGNGPDVAKAECVSCEADVSDQCTYRVSSGSAGSIHDGTTRSRWEPKGGAGEAGIKLPDSGAVCFELQWTYAPTNFTIKQYDADENVISTRTRDDDDWSYITQVYDLDPNARYLSVSFKQQNQGIAEIRIYGEGTLPVTVKKWEKPLDKCDLLVLSTHYDDEWLWFGAIIPYYALVQKKKVQVVYMANCGRRRAQEALNGLAVAGTSIYPEFVRLKDEKLKSYKQSLADWGGEEKLVGVMVEFIRRYKPEVILTHDWNGEYGHNQHKLTSHHIEKAIIAAADPEQYPESYEKYGAWQTKKLYSHLWTEQVIQFDWHKEYDEFGGLNGIELATACMNEHKSQLGAYRVSDGGKYDNSLFGLAYSTVGDDVEHNDLFENISAENTDQITDADTTAADGMTANAKPAVEAVNNTAEPTAEQAAVLAENTSEETAETNEMFTAQTDSFVTTEDNSANTGASDGAEVHGISESQAKGVGTPLWVWIAASICITGGATFILYKRRQMRRRRRRKKHTNRRHTAETGSKSRNDIARGEADTIRTK